MITGKLSNDPVKPCSALDGSISQYGIPQESTKDQDPYVLGRAFSHQSSLISDPHLSHEEYEDIL